MVTVTQTKKKQPIVKPDAGPSKKHLWISPELDAKVNDYRFTNRLESWKAACVELIEKGLAAK